MVYGMLGEHKRAASMTGKLYEAQDSTRLLMEQADHLYKGGAYVESAQKLQELRMSLLAHRDFMIQDAGGKADEDFIAWSNNKQEQLSALISEREALARENAPRSDTNE